MFAAAMQSLGCDVIDADAVAHDVLDQPEVQEMLAAWWGAEVILPSGVDRAAIARIVFDDAAARQKLEQLVHPRVESICRGRIEASKPASGVVVLDAPLLFEAGWDAWCDCVVFIDAPESVRRARVRANRGWNDAEFQARSDVQIPLDEKRARSDHVLVNAEDPASLRRQTAGLLDRLQPRTD
jgi:dephospho-CoA kinase